MFPLRSRDIERTKITLSTIALPLFDLKEELHKIKRAENQLNRKIEKAALKKERIYYWLSLSSLVIGLSAIGYRWRKYLNKWMRLKDKYNHFATKYNELLANVRAVATAQRKLNNELGGVLDSSEMQDPREYLWRDFDDDEENNTEK